MQATKEVLVSDLAIAISHFEMALNKVLSHVGQSPATLDIFYAHHRDVIAKFRIVHDTVPFYKMSTVVSATMSQISRNPQISDRLQGLSVEKIDDYYFLQY